MEDFVSVHHSIFVYGGEISNTTVNVLTTETTTHHRLFRCSTIAFHLQSFLTQCLPFLLFVFRFEVWVLIRASSNKLENQTFCVCSDKVMMGWWWWVICFTLYIVFEILSAARNHFSICPILCPSQRVSTLYVEIIICC